ncbi:hypothetical protein CEXT_292931 [Caerostris extrusa]|uniref:Uncharacterized protein n=1 Tax=Caerostris extrusa TaxID=172846 RepID=A0AAV4Y070_CAEEX|nr:hypothetical protein CEXT_292931 [Caerostris extrusa]
MLYKAHMIASEWPLLFPVNFLSRSPFSREQMFVSMAPLPPSSVREQEDGQGSLSPYILRNTLAWQGPEDNGPLQICCATNNSIPLGNDSKKQDAFPASYSPKGQD